jgi:hypothetical protein
MIDLGAGVLDSITHVGKRPKVNMSACFLPGMKVSIQRPHSKRPEFWMVIAEMTVKSVPVDGRGWPTNELIFTEPLPPEVKPGDLVVFEANRA